MNPLEPLLLILILFAGEDAQPSAQEIAKHFADLGQEDLRVAIGDDANTILNGKGIGADDLAVSPRIGQQLTRDKGLVIIRLRVENVGGGDRMLEGRIWSNGRIETHTTIVGEDINPVPIFARGAWSLIAESRPQRNAGAERHHDERASLVDLVRDQAWTKVLGRLAGTEDRSAREWYYMVLAYARLDQRAAALDTLHRMRAAHGDHILTTAANELIPPARPEEPLNGSESDILRDEDSPPLADQAAESAEEDMRTLSDPTLDDNHSDATLDDNHSDAAPD